MSSEIEEEAERLKNKLQYWAKTFNVPISDINEDAVSWLEHVANSDDPQLVEWAEFMDANISAHTPDSPRLVLIHLTVAAMSLFCFDKTNQKKRPAWGSLICAAEQLSMLEGLVGSTVFDREARSLKLSEVGKKGAKAKHLPTTKLKEWAVAQAQGMRGSEMDISRSLVHQLPAELVDASKSPQRAIYDAIRAARQTKT